MRVSGRYPFGSGAPNAEWIVTGCRMVDGDRPQFFVVPASEVTIVGNWQAVGLQGSGSGDFELDDVFVPAHRMFVSTEPLRGGPLYRVPSLISHEHVVIATGVARHALDELLRSVERERRNDGKALRDVEAIQRLVARSSLQLRAVRALAYSLVGETWEAVCAGEHMPDDASAEIVFNVSSPALTAAFELEKGVLEIPANVDVVTTGNLTMRSVGGSVPKIEVALGGSISFGN